MHNVKATRKRSVQGDDVSTPSAKRGRPKQKSLTLTRYPPLKDTADDSITISRNLESLRKELKKNSPNKENVLSMCRQTFCKRREDILDGYDGVTATNLLEKYGELHRSYVVRINNKRQVGVPSTRTHRRYLKWEGGLVHPDLACRLKMSWT